MRPFTAVGIAALALVTTGCSSSTSTSRHTTTTTHVTSASSRAGMCPSTQVSKDSMPLMGVVSMADPSAMVVSAHREKNHLSMSICDMRVSGQGFATVADKIALQVKNDLILKGITDLDITNTVDHKVWHISKLTSAKLTGDASRDHALWTTK